MSTVDEDHSDWITEQIDNYKSLIGGQNRQIKKAEKKIDTYQGLIRKLEEKRAKDE